MLTQTFDEYQAEATRTAGGDEKGLRIMSWSLGIAGEAGEIAENIKHTFFHGHDFDKDNLIEEIGDLLWYAAMLAYEYEISLSEVALKNLQKLRKRYPDGFSKERSVNRDV